MHFRVKEFVVFGAALAVVLVAFLFAFNGTAGEESAVRASQKDVPAETDFGDFGTGELISPEELEELLAPENSPLAPPSGSENAAIAPEFKTPELARVPAKAPRPAIKKFSCVGEICIDAATGNVLSARNADVRHPPASVTKLMTLFVVLDAIKAGQIELSVPVKASLRAQQTGGTQVHLAAGEVNSVDDLLYALMLQSANDAAVALAEKIAGNVEDFVVLMNAKARELGLKNTKFSTPHGLPISKKERAAGKQPDMTTAADLAKLSRALLAAHPEVFRYSAAKTKVFREFRLGIKPLPMGNHNALLRTFPGCDGLKTGWTNAGASIVTTASRGHRRVIAVVLGGIVPGAQKGSVDAKTSQRERNQRAAELMFDGFRKLDALKYEPTPEKP